MDDIRIMLLSVISVILDRYERRPDYHFIDTKINFKTGRDYADEDPICGRNTIYGWIQGRGLEALATHEAWLENSKHIDISLCKQLCHRIKKTIREILDNLENIRRKNKGHIFFMMDCCGTPLRLNENGNLEKYDANLFLDSNFSDLFYVKGMISAAKVLNDKDKLEESCQLFKSLVKNIDAGLFVSDQQDLNCFAQNNKQFKRGVSHTPWMICIGALTKFIELTGDSYYKDIGFKFIERIIKYHVNVKDDIKGFKKFDMWEHIDNKRRPYINEDGSCISDSGHAIEFVGLALKFIRINEQMGLLSNLNDNVYTIKEILISILIRNFNNGHSLNNPGIFKSIDLLSRCPINTDMPWWSLPETIRAAVEASWVVDKNKQSDIVEIAKECYNSFITHYVKMSLNLMAVPSIDQNGCISNLYPATPDMDPGYHTGLSFIDCLNILDQA
ncbi:MAG: hypothetical protein ACYC54_11680 [Sedimentisphaerales bacterium]